MAGQQQTGTLVIKILGANGKANDRLLWDEDFKQGFMKVELRSPVKHIKARSSLSSVSREGDIAWDEELGLELLPEAGELRLMLCKEKRYQHRSSAAVVAACGLFIQPLLDALPISKVFDMYKPAGGGAGGSVHIHASFVAFEEGKSWSVHSGPLPALTEGYNEGRCTENNTDEEGGRLQPRTPAATAAPGGPSMSSDHGAEPAAGSAFQPQVAAAKGMAPVQNGKPAKAAAAPEPAAPAASAPEGPATKPAEPLKEPKETAVETAVKSPELPQKPKQSAGDGNTAVKAAKPKPEVKAPNAKLSAGKAQPLQSRCGCPMQTQCPWNTSLRWQAGIGLSESTFLPL